MRTLPLRFLAISVLAILLFFTPTDRGIQGQAASKEGMHQEMLSLAIQMTALKSRIGADAGAASTYAALEAQYQQISAAMGGDDPGHLGVDRNAAPRLRPRSAQVVPIAPPGCAPSTATFTQSTPTAIPTGPAVVTSTVVVSGAGTYLFDLDLTTNLTHTFSADLDITLMSPAGTVVTLTTDNGAGNDNVFNGTLWDDDANPAGQVPYTTNNGVVTEHAYVNLTTATPLVPEEAMGAFIGEDPNGTWTITISDDLAGDGGSLDSWSVAVTTFPAAPTTAAISATNSTPVAIPTGPAVVTSNLLVSGAPTYLLDVNLTTNLTHTFSADLDVTLQSPGGTVVTLTTDNGAGNDNVFNGTVWDDDANPGGQVPYTTNNGVVSDHAYVNLTLASPLVPEEAMAAFIGEDPNGTWTITISDDLAGDGGSLDSWTLDITTATCPVGCSITCPANVTQSNDPNQCGAVVTFPAPTTSGACGTVTVVPPSGSVFPVGTTTVTASTTAGPSCTFTVTVNDTQPPTVTCPPNVSVPSGGSGGTVVTFPPPTFADNCPGATAACNPPSGSVFADGTTIVTCTGTDAAGNTALCTFTVTVVGGGPVAVVPTLSTLALVILGLLLAVGALFVLRR